MKTGSLYTTEYEGKKYEFFPGREARSVIDEMQRDALGEIKDPAAFTAIIELQELKNEIDKAKSNGDEAKVEELNKKITTTYMQTMSSVGEITKMQSKSDDEYEIAKILLMNADRVNGEVSSDLADAILENMEYELGPDKFQEVLLEMYDKVFTMRAMIQDRKDEIKKRLEKKSEPLPMS